MDLPLFGRKILVTRARPQAESFASKLKETGAEPIMAPVLSIRARHSYENNELLQKLHEFTWLFFTSANGVKFFFKQLEKFNSGLDVIKHLKIAVVGKKTETELQDFGVSADFSPETFEGKKMIAEFLHKFASDEKILLVCGNLARDDIPNVLDHKGIFYKRVIVYDTIVNVQYQSVLVESIQNNQIDALTFTSPSTIDAFEELTKKLISNVQIIKQDKLCLCIGTTTKARAVEKGFMNVRVPSEFTTEGMIKELILYFNMERKR